MFRAQNLRKNCSPRAGAFLRNHELHNDGILGESHPSWKNVTGKNSRFFLDKPSDREVFQNK